MRSTLVIGLVVIAILLGTPTLATFTGQTDRSVGLASGPPSVRPSLDYAGRMVAAAQLAAGRMTLGTAVLDLATGELEQEGAQQFYSASLSKLMLVVDLLDRDVGLSTEDYGLIGRALSLSDDDAMNALWVKFGGPAAMTRVASTLDMAGTRAPDDPSQWGEIEVSPTGFARLYQHILTEMDPADRTVVVNALSAAQPRAADGFNQFFGLLGQPGQIYAKQGWMYYGSRLYLHSAGVVHANSRDFVVVLMSIQPISANARAAITAVAAATLAPLGQT